MQYRRLGKTGIAISVISFGAGPISTLMVGDERGRQRAVVVHAIKQGINWFDTAATYGGGKSEEALGCVLQDLDNPTVHIATKVRLTSEDLADIPRAVRRSFTASLARLRVPRVTLLQLHNSITVQRGDEPTSITAADVLGPSGVARALAELRTEGLTSHIGLTGIGHPAALKEVIQSGQFETIQVPYHLLNPSAGREMPATFRETNFGNIIADCAAAQMGVLAIRVLAGGALADNPPSPHTFKTPFFPLGLYQRDRERARQLQERLGPDRPLKTEAIRFALDHPLIHSAIIGFGQIAEIDQAIAATQLASLSPLALEAE